MLGAGRGGSETGVDLRGYYSHSVRSEAQRVLITCGYHRKDLYEATKQAEEVLEVGGEISWGTAEVAVPPPSTFE